MLKLLFSLGSRKLDDWLPATTTSCTWEAVFSPIPTYYFPFPSYASGQPAFFFLLFFSSGPGGPRAWVCLGSTQVEIKLAPSRCFRLNSVRRPNTFAFGARLHPIRLIALCDLTGMTVMVRKNECSYANTYTNTHGGHNNDLQSFPASSL